MFIAPIAYNNTNRAAEFNYTGGELYTPCSSTNTADTTADIAVVTNPSWGVVALCQNANDVATHTAHETIELFIGDELILIGDTLRMLSGLYASHQQFEPSLEFIPYDTNDDGNIAIITKDDTANITLRYVNSQDANQPTVTIPPAQLGAIGQCLIDIAANHTPPTQPAAQVA